MPTVSSCLIEHLRAEFAALLPDKPEFDPTHPLGCHRRRIPHRVVFEHILDALVRGSGYERIATQNCSDRTLRRRRKSWAQQGLAQQLPALCPAAFDAMPDLQLNDISVDGAITKAGSSTLTGIPVSNATSKPSCAPLTHAEAQEIILSTKT